MKTISNIRVLLLLLLWLAIHGPLRAQCTYEGEVTYDADCDMPAILVSPDTADNVLLPVSNAGNFNLILGEEITFDYTSTGSFCNGKEIIELTCVELDFESECDFIFMVEPTPGSPGMLTVTVEPFLPATWQNATYTWTFDGNVIGSAPAVTLPDTVVGELCLEVEVQLTSGQICTEDECMLIDGSAPCVDSSLIDPNMGCPTDYAPVCGCDGMDYPNLCEALYHAGVTHFRPGPCAPINDDCNADFSYQVLDTANHKYKFEWIDDDSDIILTWIISDSTEVKNEDSFDHTFPAAGSYLVCLTAEDPQENCTQSYCEYITVGDLITDLGGGVTDYVLPGDADDDYIANLNDLLPVGVGFETAGLHRPGATNAWFSQIAFNWTDTVQNINYKHLDCDGDGLIGTSDINVIELNSAPVPPTSPVTDPDLPPVSLELAADTIVVNDDTPGEIPVTAFLKVGSSLHPVQDLYGITVAVDFPADLVNKPIAVDYNDNSFLGPASQVLHLNKSFVTTGQVDAGFVRNNQIPKSGHGTLAKMDIIIDDVIVLRTGKYIPVDFHIKAIRAIDALGNPKSLSVSDTVFTVIFVNNTQSAVLDPALRTKVQLTPTPAHNLLTVTIRDLHPERIEVFDPLGRVVSTTQDVQSVTRIPLAGLSAGTYVIRVTTAEGIVVKRFVKQ